MLVAYWGPVHGQVATTSNMLAISTMLAVDYNIQVLLTHTHFERSTLEKSFTRLRNKSNHIMDEGGIDEIERLSYCDLLTPEQVRECAVSAIENRLDVLAGTSNDQQAFLEALPHILEASRKYYKITFIDVSSGNKNDVSKIVLGLADLVVVNLNQNMSVLEPFFNGVDVPEELADKKMIYCIGNYHHNAKNTLSRIGNKFDIDKKSLCSVPFYSSYLDAQNEGDIPGCFLRWGTVKKKRFTFNETVEFMEEVRRSGKILLSTLGINAQAVEYS